MTEDAAGPTRPGRPGRPGLVEVAALSGVSIKTASRALNGEGYVAHETRQRVQQAADELGYRPNGMARELRQGGTTSTLIGMVGGDLGNPFYSKLASGLEREVRARGLQLVTVNTDENTQSELNLTDALLERRVRALVVASALPEHGHLAAEHRHGFPFIFVDRPPVGLGADAVLLDNRGGAQQAATHLLELGHTRIGVVSDLTRLSTHQECVSAFGATLHHAGIHDWRDHLLANAHDVDTAQRAVTELLSRDRPPTAIFTTNNRITTGALRVLHRHPDPPALIGFDELDMGEILGVTVITHDPENMGRQTARLLLERLDGYTGPARWVILPTRLVVRASTQRT